MPEERRRNLAETDRGLYHNKEEWLSEFLENKGAFYDGSESDDSENDAVRVILKIQKHSFADELQNRIS